MELASPLLRGVLGPLFVGHGTQKLFGWFGGQGLERTGQYFESLGLRPGRRQALAAGTAEAVSGALLTAGALTPLAGTVMSATMVTAIRRVLLEHGPWVTEGGYEYALTIIAATAAITELGPGRPSVDTALMPRIKGPRLAAAQIGAAIVASYLLDRLSKRAPGAGAEGQTVSAVDASATGPGADVGSHG
ncbi:MAG: DoxX family protein [Solirubrobacteraceae bacterium]